MPQVAVNVRTARKAAGHTQESLARAIDVSVSTVQGWESQTFNRLPQGTNLSKLCAALGHEPGWFYTEHPVDEQVAA